MAHHLTTAMVCALAASAHTAWAETLPDPTRPPAFLFAPADGEGPATESAGGGMILQSVLIAPNRRSAIIGGKALSVGDRLGDFTLVRVSEGEVQLRGPEGSRTLKLFPSVTKRVAHGGDTAADSSDAAARSIRGTQ